MAAFAARAYRRECRFYLSPFGESTSWSTSRLTLFPWALRVRSTWFRAISVSRYACPNYSF